MKCQRCYSNRVADINAKCSDRFDCEYQGIGYSGYVPLSLEIGGNDDVSFSYCFDCGQIQGNFPLNIDFEKLKED